MSGMTADGGNEGKQGQSDKLIEKIRKKFMEVITLNAQINSDGLLQLQLPDRFKNHHVTVTIRSESPEWLSVLQKTAGTIPDLERPSQGE